MRSPVQDPAADVVSVLVVDPLPVLRSAIAALIDGEPGFEVAGLAASGAEALTALAGRKGHPRTVVLVSASLDGPTGAAALIGEIQLRFPHTHVVATGANAGPNTLASLLAAGADGFVDQAAPTEDFLAAVRQASDGEVVMAGVGRDRLGAVAEGLSATRADRSRLSPREAEVIAAAADGLTARQIGRRLGLRERTVTTLLSRAYTKLGVSNRMAAVAVAARAGILAGRDAE